MNLLHCGSGLLQLAEILDFNDERISDRIVRACIIIQKITEVAKGFLLAFDPFLLGNKANLYYIWDLLQLCLDILNQSVPINYRYALCRFGRISVCGIRLGRISCPILR